MIWDVFLLEKLNMLFTTKTIGPLNSVKGSVPDNTFTLKHIQTYKGSLTFKKKKGSPAGRLHLKAINNILQQKGMVKICLNTIT